jgi:hypothetical protein
MWHLTLKLQRNAECASIPNNLAFLIQWVLSIATAKALSTKTGGSISVVTETP